MWIPAMVFEMQDGNHSGLLSLYPRAFHDLAASSVDVPAICRGKQIAA
jgi:hypothetical protein